MDASLHSVRPTRRFSEKCARIVDAAAQTINSEGVRGLTFVNVASRLSMTTTSITYYFKRREMLVEAAMDAALDRLEVQVALAAGEADGRARTACLIRSVFAMWRAVRAGEEGEPARLAEMRALEEGMRARLGSRYVGILRALRSFFDDEPGLARCEATMRTHLLVENMHWLAAWIANYTRADFDRTADRLNGLLADGFLPAAMGPPLRLPPAAEDGEEAQSEPREAFLAVATRLINQRGYRGASIDRIAAELNVTKGSFYHHLGGKDELLLACFERSYARQSAAQHRAIALDASGAERLVAAIAALVGDQFEGQHELLRTAALEMLPADSRALMISRSHRIARRFAGMLVDGMSDGSIRIVDPMIGAQAIMVAINSAVELRRPDMAVDCATYVRLVTRGLFARE